MNHFSKRYSLDALMIFSKRLKCYLKTLTSSLYLVASSILLLQLLPWLLTITRLLFQTKTQPIVVITLFPKKRWKTQSSPTTSREWVAVQGLLQLTLQKNCWRAQDQIPIVLFFHMKTWLRMGMMGNKSQCFLPTFFFALEELQFFFPTLQTQLHHQSLSWKQQ